MTDSEVRRPTWEQARGQHVGPFGPCPAPRELPDLRLHLMDRWRPGGLLERALRSHHEARNWGRWEWEADIAFEREMLRAASLWWVKGDMLDLVIAAMAAVPDDVTAGDLEFPADQDAGLIVFERPWLGKDAENAGLVAVDAMLWGRSRAPSGQPGLSVSSYRYFDFGAGMTGPELRLAAFETILEGHSEYIGTNPDGQASFRVRGGAWCYLGRSDWLFSEQVERVDWTVRHRKERGTEEELAEWRSSVFEDRRFFAAFCALVNHKLSDVEAIQMDRPTRRRTERKGITAGEPSTVRYVKLREIVHQDRSEPTGRVVEHDHRWMRTGHMGWRWCGPGKTQRRLTWISPAICGPEDKPLVIKSTVRVWSR